MRGVWLRKVGRRGQERTGTKIDKESRGMVRGPADEMIGGRGDNDTACGKRKVEEKMAGERTGQEGTQKLYICRNKYIIIYIKSYVHCIE